MARLDWFSFLRQHGIPYTTTGPNASAGRVNVKCPFCSDDPSEHMGISIGGHGWSCWRNASHRGRSAPKLIDALIKCGMAEATRLAGGDVALPEDQDLGSELRSRLGEQQIRKPKLVSLNLPHEFKPLDNGSRFADQFLEYLSWRGYKKTQLKWLVKTYDLHYATSGKFAYRVIIPIYDRWGKLLTWTGRSILPDEELRYLTLKREQQICAPKETLLGLPLLWSCPNPKVLLVCEGPFDAFWVTAFGRSLGVYGTCLFGLTMSSPQAELLLDLRRRFPRQALLLDSAARFQAFRMANSGVRMDVVRLDEDVKDPATLTPNALLELCMQLTTF